MHVLFICMSGYYEYVQQDLLQNLLIAVEAALLRCCCYDTLLVVNDCILFAKSPMKGVEMEICNREE